MVSPRHPAPAPDASAHEWSARRQVKRSTVDLSGTPGLVVMYLGMRVKRPLGYLTALRFVRRIRHAVGQRPDGLLLHEPMLYSPVHLGFRQYWRDFDSLEEWARSEPHRSWWREYLQDTRGTGFWHETYFMGGGFEAIYDGIDSPVGLMRFAPVVPATGGMFSARRRLHKSPVPPANLPEEERGEPPVARDDAPQEI